MLNGLFGLGAIQSILGAGQASSKTSRQQAADALWGITMAGMLSAPQAQSMMQAQLYSPMCFASGTVVYRDSAGMLNQITHSPSLEPTEREIAISELRECLEITWDLAPIY